MTDATSQTNQTGPADPTTQATPAAHPADEGWDEQRWVVEARYLRDALRAVGMNMAYCLPGEPNACGGSADVHYASYLGVLRARLDLFWFNLNGYQLAVAATSYRDETVDALQRSGAIEIADANVVPLTVKVVSP